MFDLILAAVLTATPAERPARIPILRAPRAVVQSVEVRLPAGERRHLIRDLFERFRQRRGTTSFR